MPVWSAKDDDDTAAAAAAAAAVMKSTCLLARSHAIVHIRTFASIDKHYETNEDTPSYVRITTLVLEFEHDFLFARATIICTTTRLS